MAKSRAKMWGDSVGVAGLLVVVFTAAENFKIMLIALLEFALLAVLLYAVQRAYHWLRSDIEGGAPNAPEDNATATAGDQK